MNQNRSTAIDGQPHDRLFRILVVDDEPSIRNALGTWFEKRGFETHVAENGAEGVKRCEGTPFDVILLDLEMPVMNGHDAMHAIRALDAHVPIIVFTGYSSEAVDLSNVGATRVLQKPLSMLDLEAQVRACIDQRGS
jgi:CheY-like chemotaxis protein